MLLIGDEELITLITFVQQVSVSSVLIGGVILARLDADGEMCSRDP